MIERRPAKPEEVKQIIDLANDIFRVSSNLEPSMGRQFPTFLCPENSSNLYVAVDEGRVISHIGIKKNTAIVHGHKLSMASMGSVCTHPDYRGQGLGTKLLYDVFDSLKEQGVSMVKISGSRGLYKRNGCIQVEGIARFQFDKTSYFGSRDASLEYRWVEADRELPLLVDMYQGKAIRYSRTKWEFPILFKAMPMVHPSTGLFCTAVIAQSSGSQNRDLAYIAGYQREPGLYVIVEYAGESMAIPGLIAYLFEAGDIDKVILDIPAHDEILMGVLQPYSKGGYETRISSSTLKITNRDSLWSQIYPLIVERWPDKNPPQGLDELPQGMGEADETTLDFIFGTYQRRPYGEPWDSVFPIGLPWAQGFDYI